MLKPDVSADLVDRVRRGEAEAYAGLVRAYLRPAYAVALSVVGRPADAEDIAQDAFLKAFAAIDTCHEPERFGAWLFQIVRNRARNLLESRALREVVTDGRRVLEFVLMPPESAGMREALLTALADLEVEDRQVVRFLAGPESQIRSCTRPYSRRFAIHGLRDSASSGSVTEPSAGSLNGGRELQPNPKYREPGPMRPARLPPPE